MHRLNERFPRRVLLWPVIVQGPTAAGSVAGAIKGFNALAKDDPLRFFLAGEPTVSVYRRA